MAKEQIDSRYVSYPLFKGLQKPLEFMGIQGRYITWAACAVGGAIIGFIIVYCMFGFLAGLAEEGSSHKKGRPWCIYLCLLAQNVISNKESKMNGSVEI